MEIKLTKEEIRDLENLRESEVLVVTYKGMMGFITPDKYGNINFNGREYTFNFYCPAWVKISVKE